MTNHLRAAWRHFTREKRYTAITVFGLVLGLAAGIFITLFVIDEFAYDRYNVNADRIFRLAADIHINGGTENYVATPPPMAAALVHDFPGVENAVRIRPVRKDVAVLVDNKVFLQTNVFLADSTLFSVFTLPMIAGDAHTALSVPNAIVLSATTAKRYFNTTDAVGRTLQFDQDTAVYKVTGVIRDMPAASHIHLQLIMPIHQKRQDWVNLYAATYVLARPGVGTAEIDRMLTQEVENHVYPQIRKELHNTEADVKRNGDHFRYYSIALTRIHLYSNLEGEFETNGNIEYVILLIIVAVLILIVAGINFVNLSMARSLRRLREIGVRKILGSNRQRLIAQFLVESMLNAGIAMVMAVVLVIALLPFFDALAGKSFTASIVLSHWTIPALFLATALVGLLSGAYPALVLSRVEPLKILRGQLTLGTRPTMLRTALMVFQFSIAIMLIIGTGVIYSQLSYIRNRDIGYNRQQVVTIEDTHMLGDHIWTFANEARKLPGVVSATVSGFLPNQHVIYRGIFKDRSGSETATALLGDWQIDADYLPTLGMKLTAGRNFSSQMPTDSECVLVNETAARALGYVQPLGQKIYYGTDSTTGYTIIGVVRDFNTGSMRNPIDPVAFRLKREDRAVTLRLTASHIPETLKKIRQKYETLADGHPFVYSFLDEDFNRLYAADARTGSLFTVFAALAIIIAALGMFGLVTAATETRAKELGIRRVLGARVIQLMSLLLKDYGPAIALAILIALPAAGWVMHAWLQEFVYRTRLQPSIFVAAPLCAIAIAGTIVAVKASRATFLNVADVLREE